MLFFFPFLPLPPLSLSPSQSRFSLITISPSIKIWPKASWPLSFSCPLCPGYAILLTEKKMAHCKIKYVVMPALMLGPIFSLLFKAMLKKKKKHTMYHEIGVCQNWLISKLKRGVRIDGQHQNWVLYWGACIMIIWIVHHYFHSILRYFLKVYLIGSLSYRSIDRTSILI